MQDTKKQLGISNNLTKVQHSKDYRWHFRMKASASALAHGGSWGQGRITRTRVARGKKYPATFGQCVLHVKRVRFPKTRTWILSIAEPTSTLEREPNSSADEFPTAVAAADDCQNALVQKL